MVMIEAMACGLPVISFDFLCGPRDIIRSGENGLIVPEGDVAALADAMRRLMESPETLARMSATAPEVSDTYAETTIMQQWEQLFNAITQ